MLDYLKINNLLNKHQHGFLAKKSTITNLLESVNDWILSIKNSCDMVRPKKKYLCLRLPPVPRKTLRP